MTEKNTASRVRLIKIITLALSLLLLCAIFASCNTQNELEETNSTAEQTEAATEAETVEDEDLVEVFVFNKDMIRGEKVTRKILDKVKLPRENLPPNTVNTMDEIQDKYLSRDFYKGDYVLVSALVESKSDLSSEHLKKREISKSEDDYLVVTDYVKANTGEDLYVILQELIDKNPGRTIYFPDGEYVISHSLLTTSRADQSTSFLFSSDAVLKAADLWEREDSYNSLISLGAYEKVNNINAPGSNFYVIGGKFDGNGVADGIAIDAGRETLVKDVLIVNTRYGIHIKSGTNSNSSDTDIDDVTIIGNGNYNSIGIIFSGDDNTVTNARISNVATGVVASNTCFLSCITVENTMKLRGTPGFLLGINSYISNCVSVDYDIGFQLEGSNCFIKQCSVIWPSNEGEEHVAFKTDKLRASIIGCRAEFVDNKAKNIFLVSNMEGWGMVQSPYYDRSLVDVESDFTNFYLFKGERVPIEDEIEDEKNKT